MSAYRANIRKLYAFRFLMGMHFFAGVLIPFFTQWGGISFAQVMLLQSWFVFWIFLLEVPTGTVADHFGRKTSLMCGALVHVLAVLAYITKPDFYVFLFAEFLWALAGALISGADDAIVYDTLKELGEEKESKTVMGRFESFQLAAIMVSAPIGSLAAASIDLRVPMLMMSLPFTAAAVVAWTVKEPESRRPDPSTKYFETLVGGLRYFARHPVLRVLAFDSISVFSLSFMIIWLSQPVLQSLGVPIAWFGFVFSASTGAQILVNNSFARLEAIAGGRRRFLAASGLVAAACYLALSVNRDPWVAAGLIVLLAASGLARGTLIANYMNKHIDSHNRATVLSSVSMLKMLTGAFVYPVVGLLQKWSLPGCLAVLGATLLVCVWFSEVREEHLLN